MPIYLNSTLENMVQFQSGIPLNYSGPFLKGSNLLYFSKDSCLLIIQEIITEFYTIRLNVFRFLEELTLTAVSKKEGIHSRILLKGNLGHKIRGNGLINLREGEFTMLWADNTNCSCRFHKDVEYRTLDIFYSPRLLQQFVPFFPELRDLKDERSRVLLNNPCFVTPVMNNITRQILQCPFDESATKFYFDLKVREYLLVMLQRIYRSKPSRYRFNSYENTCIIKAHKILLEDISKKPLTIRKLAKAVAINEYKLKAGFLQLFGSSAFGCLQEARLQKARELLLSTDEPLKLICTLTGYPRITNFITAFRKRFGYTPGSLRRK